MNFRKAIAQAKFGFAAGLLLLFAAPTGLAAAQTLIRTNPPRYSVTAKPSPKTLVPPRYRQATFSEIQSNRHQALQWAEKTRTTIAPAMHLVETQNFLIFSAWDASHDKALGNVCEEMNAKLRKQFNLQPNESAWAGKCPVYVFWRKADFRRFATEVDQSPVTQSKIARTDGYHATRGWFAYIVISGIQDFGNPATSATTRFYEVLVHEGTHGFMSRFMGHRPMPLWIEEGLADYMAATLVPTSVASRKYLDGTRYALATPNVVSSVFDKKDFVSIDYGIAQSLVRYLIAIDSHAFVRLVERLKQGVSDEKALGECFGISRAELVRRWTKYSKQYRARPLS